MNVDIFFSGDLDFIFSYLVNNNINSLYAFSIIINNLFVRNAVDIINEGIKRNYFVVDELLENFLELFITKDLFFLISERKEYYHKIFDNSTLFLCSLQSLKIFDFIYKQTSEKELEFYSDNDKLRYCIDYEIAYKFHTNILWQSYCYENFSDEYIDRLSDLFNLPSYVFQNKVNKVSKILKNISPNQRTISNIPAVHFCNSKEMLDLFISQGVDLYKMYIIYINDKVYNADMAYSMAYASEMYFWLYENGYHFDNCKYLILETINDTRNPDFDYYKNALIYLNDFIDRQKEILLYLLPDYIYYKVEEFIFLK
jgi:hypothetical protein